MCIDLLKSPYIRQKSGKRGDTPVTFQEATHSANDMMSFKRNVSLYKQRHPASTTATKSYFISSTAFMTTSLVSFIIWKYWDMSHKSRATSAFS